jgi:phosphotransferase system  glucose/maltose/N-acetylglucosamine-specific IIC component
MSIFKQFIKSLHSPKHIAAFRMQGIGKTIHYLFFLALVMCIPMIIYMILYAAGDNESARTVIETKLPILTLENDLMEANSFIFLPAVLTMYYLFVSFILFMKVSIFGGIGLWLAHILKKRAEYRHTFRMAAYAVTLSALLIAITELTGFTLPSGYLFDWITISTMLIMAVRYLPGTPK